MKSEVMFPFPLVLGVIVYKVCFLGEGAKHKTKLLYTLAPALCHAWYKKELSAPQIYKIEVAQACAIYNGGWVTLFSPSLDPERV